MNCTRRSLALLLPAMASAPREGEVEGTVDGHATRLGPGSCAYIASNDLHVAVTPELPSKYFLLALGTD